MSQEPLNPELAALEARLTALTPRPAGLDRDRLMFLAGRAAAAQTARRGWTSWLWPCATAASLALAVVLGLRGARPQPVGPQAADVAAAAPDTSRPGPNSYMELRARLLARGVDALPESSASADPSPAQPLRPMDRRHFEAWLGG
jgi:hypothetical protein